MKSRPPAIDYGPVEEDITEFDDFPESSGQEEEERVEHAPVATSGAVTNMALAPPPKVSDTICIMDHSFPT